MNCTAIDTANMTRSPAIRYFTYIPNPLCEISKESSGLLMLLPLPHMPVARIVQHSGMPSTTEPTRLDQAWVRGGEARVEHVHPHVPLVDQRVGAAEEKERRVPEAHQVAHERLLVGEHEARDDDLELGQHHQEGEPDEVETARPQRDEEARAP